MRASLRIVGASCATCIVPVRRVLERLDGVEKVGINYVADLLLVDYDPAKVGLAEIVDAIKSVGYQAIPITGLSRRSH
jgi:copper chaperone CopZ